MRISSNYCNTGMYVFLSKGMLYSFFVFSFFMAKASYAELRVFACEPEYADLIKILAPNSNIYTATTAFQDPHLVQARPSLIAKMRQADLVICAGADLEVGWLPMLQIKSANPKVQNGQSGLFLAADMIETLDKKEKVTRDMGDVHAKGNPHVHFDPKLMVEIAEKLTQRLSLLNPADKEIYQTNLDKFKEQWQRLTEDLTVKALPLKGQNVIAYHSNFRYLFNWLGINQVADLEPKPGLPPSTSHLAKLLSLAKKENVKAIVIASYQNDRGAKWLSSRTNIPIVILPLTVGGNRKSTDLMLLYQNVVQLLLDSVGVSND